MMELLAAYSNSKIRKASEERELIVYNVSNPSVCCDGSVGSSHPCLESGPDPLLRGGVQVPVSGMCKLSLLLRTQL